MSGFSIPRTWRKLRNALVTAGLATALLAIRTFAQTVPPNGNTAIQDEPVTPQLIIVDRNPVPCNETGELHPLHIDIPEGLPADLRWRLSGTRWLDKKTFADHTSRSWTDRNYHFAAWEEQGLFAEQMQAGFRSPRGRRAGDEK